MARQGRHAQDVGETDLVDAALAPLGDVGIHGIALEDADGAGGTLEFGGIHGNVEARGLTAVTTVANGANNVGFLGDACQTIGGITSGVGADC